jgi:hypothetical protein
VVTVRPPDAVNFMESFLGIWLSGSAAAPRPSASPRPDKNARAKEVALHGDDVVPGRADIDTHVVCTRGGVGAISMAD